MMRFIDFVVGKSGSMHGVSRSRQNNGFEEVGQHGKDETCKVQTMRGDRQHVHDVQQPLHEKKKKTIEQVV